MDDWRQLIMNSLAKGITSVNPYYYEDKGLNAFPAQVGKQVGTLPDGRPLYDSWKTIGISQPQQPEQLPEPTEWWGKHSEGYTREEEEMRDEADIEMQQLYGPSSKLNNIMKLFMPASAHAAELPKPDSGIKTQLTTLDPQRESAFVQAIKQTPWYQEYVTQYGEQPNLNTPWYDYRAAWQAGAAPNTRNAYDNQFHWPSQFKTIYHPSWWMGRWSDQMRADPQAVGSRVEAERLLRGGM